MKKILLVFILFAGMSLNAITIDENKKACDSGNSMGCYSLGVIYLEGISVKQDNSQAFKWFEMAAKQNLPEGLYMTGSFYEEGTEVAKDIKKALGYYARAADLGENRALERIKKEPLLKEGLDLRIKGMNEIEKGNYQSAIEHFQKSVPLREKALGKGHSTVATTYDTISNYYYEIGNYAKALEYASKALTIQEKTLGVDDPRIIFNYERIGWLYEEIGDYPNALKYTQKALTIQEKVSGEKHADILRFYNRLRFIYQSMKNYPKALEYAKKVLMVNENILGKEHAESVRSYDRLSSLYQSMQDYPKALKSAEKVLAIRKKVLGTEHIDVSQSYDDLSFLYQTMGDYPKALEYAQKALAINEKVLGKEHIDTITNYRSIGLLYQIAGEYSKALVYNQKALAINKKILGNDHADTATSYISLGFLYQLMGDYSRSLEYYQNALTINKKLFGEHDIATGINYLSLGTIYQFMGEYEKALKYHQKSLSIMETVLGKEHISTAVNYTYTGSVYQVMGYYPEALEYYQKAVAINENVLGKGHASTGGNYSSLASLYQEIGDFSKALTYYQKALTITENTFGKEHILTAVNYNTLGSLYQKMEDSSQAQYYAKLAFNIFLKTRDQVFTLLDTKQKEKYLKTTTSFITLLLQSSYRYINQLKKEKNSTKVQHLLQSGINAWFNYKGSIFDSENAIVMLYNHTKDPKLKTKIDDLVFSKRALAKLYQSLPEPKEIEMWKTKIKNTEAKIAKLTNEIDSKATRFKEQQGLKSIGHQDITSHLKDNELYIDYAKAGGHYYLFSLDHQENISFMQIDKKSTTKIDKLVKAFREDVNTILKDTKITDEKLKRLTKSSKETLSQLYTLVIKKPLGNTIKEKTSLIISSDGALRLLPFETLFDKGNNKYFIEEKEIRYIPSGKELVRLYKYSKDKESKSKKSAVIFANPNFSSTIATPPKEENATKLKRSGVVKSLVNMKKFSQLPGTKAEAKAVKATFKKGSVSEYLQDEASEVNFMKVKKPNILHVATHGFFINDDTIPNPMLKSGIVLAGANISRILGIDYGIVTALKLSGLDLKGTDLVVLSACQTGVVDINSTDSISGLSKAFIQAGAKDIVMSLWSVDDEATKELMSSFYLEMQKKKNYAKALKAAKLKMIEEGRHPFYWGAFVVSGL